MRHYYVRRKKIQLWLKQSDRLEGEVSLLYDLLTADEVKETFQKAAFQNENWLCT